MSRLVGVVGWQKASRAACLAIGTHCSAVAFSAAAFSTRARVL